MKTKFIVILAAFMIVASEGVSLANNVCWEMMVSSLKGEHLLYKDNPDTAGDYVKNTLLFPFGLIGSATMVVMSPFAMVFAPSGCFESSDPEANERLQDIERSNFSTLQQMNNQFQRSGGSSGYSGASGASSAYSGWSGSSGLSSGAGSEYRGVNMEGNDFECSLPGAARVGKCSNYVPSPSSEYKAPSAPPKFACPVESEMRGECRNNRTRSNGSSK